MSPPSGSSTAVQVATFRGEFTAEAGLASKQTAGDPHAIMTGSCNSYIDDTPTDKQRWNQCHAQEDCDTLVAPACVCKCR